MSNSESNSNLINLHFDDNRKRQGLTSESSDSASISALVDKSRKGSIDTRILGLVNWINGTEDLFTTSTCSGRAILFTHDEMPEKVEPGSGDASEAEHLPVHAKTTKKGCNWLYTSHDLINPQELLDTWTNLPLELNVNFKIEPSIFHIQCRSLSVAKELIHLGTESGFRNSGMVIGKDNKITVAIRSAIGMEVPLRKTQSSMTKSMINNEYITFLSSIGNEKLSESWDRTDKFFIKLKNKFTK